MVPPFDCDRAKSGGINAASDDAQNRSGRNKSKCKQLGANDSKEVSTRRK